MTTKTFPEYFEDDRRKLSEAQFRPDEESARIQASHHGHYRTAKQPKIESPRKPNAAAKTTGTQKKNRVTRKATTKARKSGRKYVLCERMVTSGKEDCYESSPCIMVSTLLWVSNDTRI